MNSDIETLVSQCIICEKFKKANSKEPLKPHTMPYKPIEKIGVDIMDLGNTSYLVVIDYYSKWIKIAELVNKSADESCMYSRHHCKRYHRWAAVNGMQRSGRRANRPSLCRRLATEKRDTCREATRSMSSSSLFSPEEGYIGR
ncbi:uncharacterized protein K02A2.6 [Trichonephila clavipes]|nr:uncharacterized protein K02A2.6 [Trichonephila clavipes]